MESRGHSFRFKIDQLQNGTFMASVVHEKSNHHKDDLGALYYVVAVLLIYGCSILMMLASYVRKNKMDRKLNRYHKEMANVRKRERQLQLCSAAAKAAAANMASTDDSVHTQVEKKLSNISQSSDISDCEQGQSKNLEGMRSLTSHRKNDKMLLEIPSGGYNTDSDNETSTEGEYCYIPSKPAKSILKPVKSVKLILPPPLEPTSQRLQEPWQRLDPPSPFDPKIDLKFADDNYDTDYSVSRV